MTLPSARKFPKLPTGYLFEIEFDGVNYTHRENEYHIWVLDEGGQPLVSELRVIESYVLDVARRLADLAYLEVDARGGYTAINVATLNVTLKERASK